MTTENNGDRVSLVRKREETSEGRAGLAAARASHRVAGLLDRAKEFAKIKNSEIARGLNVSEGRVSQVLNGDGNFHIATIARFLSAMGYELVVSARPRDPESNLPDLESPKPRRRAAKASQKKWDFYEQFYGCEVGLSRTIAVVERPASATTESIPLGGPRLLGTVKARHAPRHDLHWSGVEVLVKYGSGEEAADWSELTLEALKLGEEVSP